jgi:YidC/Oxa1 family membrane protein insertase
MFKTFVQNARQSAHEMTEIDRLFRSENKAIRELAIYSERDIYWNYYVDYIEQILARSDKTICYLSSDIDDPIFKTTQSRIKPFYIKNMLAAVFERLDSKVLIMTTPDLNKGAVKRAPGAVHHCYVFHGISSVHQSYRLGAFDAYDSLMCIAPYQVEEVRKTEALYGLKPKLLPVVGYPLVERIHREHQIFERNTSPHGVNEQICLIAPTWDYQGKASLMDSCVDDMLEALAKSRFKVWLRPHPEYVKRFPKKIDLLRKQMSKYSNITLQMELGSMQCLHEADVLVTDHSGIAMEYVLGTDRPVLYIDTPTRTDNSECDRLNIEPIENKLRGSMGARLAPSEIKNIAGVLEKLIAEKDAFRQNVPNLRNQLVANWQHSAPIGCDFILGLCDGKQN